MIVNHSTKVSVKDETARLVDVEVGGKIVKAAAAMGHGVLNGLCGDCFITKTVPEVWGGEARYAVTLQVDVRAWSLEISRSAAFYMSNWNGSQCVENGYSHGKCCIPDVMPVDCDAVMKLNAKKSA